MPIRLIKTLDLFNLKNKKLKFKGVRIRIILLGVGMATMGCLTWMSINSSPSKTNSSNAHLTATQEV